MPNQNKLDKTYLKMAEAWAEMSHARRKKVGCLIVKDGAIISDGYNGTPSGFDNNCEFGFTQQGLTTKPEVLHAESNAISKLARSTNSSDGATVYLTCSPCFDCAKLIIQAGIKRVVYSDNYRDSRGLQLLEKANIQVDHINDK